MDVESLLERISGYNHEKVHQRLSGKRLAGTTRWLLNHPDFKAWFIEKRFPTLWCSGKIGSGKTMIATAVIEAAKYELGSPTVFFYCEGDGHAGLDVSSILSSLIKQLCEYLHRMHRMHRPYPEGVAKEIRKFFGDKRVKPDFDDLKDIFTHLFHHTPDTIYVVDGVDALDQKHAKSLLELVRLLFIDTTPQQQSRILLLSRDQVPGYININTFIPGIRQISTSANVMQDIKTYIESSIIDKNICRKLTDDPVLIEKVRQRLLAESSGMFLWVYLQLEILWDTCFDDAAIQSALAKLPKSLEATYSRCIERIDHKDSRVLKVLKWVSFATIPLHIEELREAIAFDLEDTAWSAEKIPRKEFVIGCCANLVVVDSTDDRVRFAHSSVRQYLEKGRQRNIIQGYPASEQGILECGEFCVAYLSFSDFSLQLSTRRIEKAAVPVRSPILFAQETLPALLTRHLFQKPRDQKRSVSALFHRIRTASMPDRAQYRFLDYAVTNWALQTKQIRRTSLMWEKFERLAMCFNETWNFHPWVPGGRSASSHLHGLLGWAVMEQHEPLLSIAQGEGPALRLVCNLPLIGESLPALHVAAKLGYEAMIEILLDFCKVNAPDLEGYTALHHAASRGHIEICQLLCSSKKIKVDALSRFQRTPLWLAASNGHEEVVSLLAEKQADIETKDVFLHQTPLSRAAEMGHDVVVELLLGKGAELESQDAGGRTPLSCAVEQCHETTIELLLENGANLNTKDLDITDFLIWATEKGFMGIVRLFCRNTADLNIKDKSGRTLLSRAAESGHEEVMKVLLESGADVEAKDKQMGQTPLIWAVKNGHEAVVKVLLETGADVEAKDKEYGQTPLLWAAIYGHKAVVKVLLENGADPEAKDKEYGRTPLAWASENVHEAVVKVLLESGAHFEAKDKQMAPTPLLRAAVYGHKAVVKVLLENGADPEAKDKEYGQTPLLWAAIYGHEAVVKVLLENGADPEAKDKEYGQTPLIWAINNGHEAVVKLLLGKSFSGSP
ncbi:hypothetical protein N7494_000285 [Penicillium frequentans]|uniref:Uncharacterized protein n=1 Tax=Penicillium frequentans TaxID=3151616 RepID=A0AAD6GKX5_9EURO|nr:hypothetical protein N7494_000285 [Penicillium glabrum]